MALPELPWYGKLKEILAPSEPVTNVVLLIIIVITLMVLIWGDEVAKALLAVYWVSP